MSFIVNGRNVACKSEDSRSKVSVTAHHCKRFFRVLFSEGIVRLQSLLSLK